MMEWQQLLADGKDTKSGTSYDPVRSPFERDFDRIIFSHPFRRLQDKTQVHPMPEHDFVHTRLSHSLEVSSVGRSLGKAVGNIVLQRHPELTSSFSMHDFGGIVAAASLAHDIGNPPFGHSGENAISDFFLHHPLAVQFKEKLTDTEWADFTNFEGNAQGFRILTNKHFQSAPLTLATLAAFSKYPRESKIDNRDKARRSQKKFGFFQSEKEAFEDMANRVGLMSLSDSADKTWARHPLTFLVEAADDICYGIIDLEDGCRLGLISLDDTIDLLAPILGDKLDTKKLNNYGTLEDKVGLLRALSISVLIEECVERFLDTENDILSATFDESLTDVIPSEKALAEIGRVSLEKIYRSPKVLEIEAVGFEILPGILESITAAGFRRAFDRENATGKDKALERLLPVGLQSKFTEGVEIYDLLIHCTDFIANMTDTGALSFYRKIKGIELPKG